MNVKWRFVAAYILCGFIAAIPYVAITLEWKQLGTKPSKTQVAVSVANARAQAVKEASGDQNLAAQCEANLTQQLNQAGGSLTKPYKLVKSTHKGNKATVSVKVTADIY